MEGRGPDAWPLVSRAPCLPVNALRPPHPEPPAALQGEVLYPGPGSRSAITHVPSEEGRSQPGPLLGTPGQGGSASQAHQPGPAFGPPLSRPWPLGLQARGWGRVPARQVLPTRGDPASAHSGQGAQPALQHVLVHLGYPQARNADLSS